MNTMRDESGRITMGAPLWIQQPWLDEVLTGRKTIEGRVLGTNKKSKWKEGDVVFVGHGQDDYDLQQAVIMNTHHYASFGEYLKEEWKRAAPQCNSLAEAVEAHNAVMTISKGVEVDGVKAGEKICAFDPRRVVARGGVVALEIQLP